MFVFESCTGADGYRYNGKVSKIWNANSPFLSSQIYINALKSHQWYWNNNNRIKNRAVRHRKTGAVDAQNAINSLFLWKFHLLLPLIYMSVRSQNGYRYSGSISKIWTVISLFFVSQIYPLGEKPSMVLERHE